MRLATKLRRFAINLTLVLASTLVVLGVLEVLARLIYKDEGLGPIFPAPGEAQAILQKSAIAGLRYEYIPGSTKYNCYPDNPRGYFDPDNCIRYFINAQGFRGPEVSQRKPAGVFRILGLGDSFMLGVGVRDEDTYLRRLERLLNRSGRGKFEVLNFGVEGYNTEDEASLFAGRGVEYDPDLVLVFSGNNEKGKPRRIRSG